MISLMLLHRMFSTKLICSLHNVLVKVAIDLLALVSRCTDPL